MINLRTPGKFPRKKPDFPSNATLALSCVVLFVYSVIFTCCIAYLSRDGDRLCGRQVTALELLESGRCPTDWVSAPQFRKCYWPDSVANHTTGIKRCQSLGAKMLTINGPEENKFILEMEYDGDPVDFQGYIWLAPKFEPSRSTLPGRLIGLDGEEPAYQNFGPGEPNNHGGNEDCIFLRGIEVGQYLE
ncbi:unnamed protein product, partial [Mesorhabditis spiculigera]